MRNFWINSNIEGRNTDLASGPRRNDGSMTTELYVNEKGESSKALTIVCRPNGDTLNITTRFFDNHEVTVTASKTESGLIIKDSFKSNIARILDEDLPPSQKLKLIKNLL